MSSMIGRRKLAHSIVPRAVVSESAVWPMYTSERVTDLKVMISSFGTRRLSHGPPRRLLHLELAQAARCPAHRARLLARGHLYQVTTSDIKALLEVRLDLRASVCPASSSAWLCKLGQETLNPGEFRACGNSGAIHPVRTMCVPW